MISASAFVLALAASFAAAHPAARAPASNRCATTISAEKRVEAEEHFKANRVKADNGTQAVEISVVWHVISKDDTLEGGQVPDDQIADQITALNAAYSNTSLTFSLTNTSRVTNADWFAKASPFDDGIDAQTEMKTTLRQGDAAVLNLYSVGFSEGEAAQGLLGYATFPSDYEANPKDDGVVFLFSTTPGGTTAPFNLGGTVQHETGHWTGLYHVFNEEEYANTCEGPGDEVADTPMESSPASGCPANRDTCTSDPGLDPIHNYMDYTDDSCYTEFTAGQIVRLHDQMATYRNVTF